MQFNSSAARRRDANRSPASPASPLLVASASLSALVLSLAALLAGTLGAWRVGAALGWTSQFFVAEGPLSRYQLWFAASVCAQAAASILNRWVARQWAEILPDSALDPTAGLPVHPSGRD